MPKISELQIELLNEKNETLIGTLTFSVPDAETVNKTMTSEADAKGASTYIATVISVYAIAIVFLIASHVFVKKKEDRVEYQMSIVNKYWKQAHKIKERGARESYKKLKQSMVPAVAKSGARDLVSRRKSFAPILANAGIYMDRDKQFVMPPIEEGESDSDIDEEYTVLPSITVTNENISNSKHNEAIRANGKGCYHPRDIAWKQNLQGTTGMYNQVENSTSGPNKSFFAEHSRICHSIEEINGDHPTANPTVRGQIELNSGEGDMLESLPGVHKESGWVVLKEKNGQIDEHLDCHETNSKDLNQNQAVINSGRVQLPTPCQSGNPDNIYMLALVGNNLEKHPSKHHNDTSSMEINNTTGVITDFEGNVSGHYCDKNGMESNRSGHYGTTLRKTETESMSRPLKEVLHVTM